MKIISECAGKPFKQDCCGQPLVKRTQQHQRPTTLIRVTTHWTSYHRVCVRGRKKEQCVVMCAQLTEKLQGGDSWWTYHTVLALLQTPSLWIHHPTEQFHQKLCLDWAGTPKCGCAENIGNVLSDLLGCQRNHLSDHLPGLHSHPPAMKQWHIRPRRNTALVLSTQAVLKHLEISMLRKLLIFQT